MSKPAKELWRALRHQIGRRGTFLAFLAFLDFVFAYEFWRISLGSAVIGPQWLWALGWVSTGIACMIGVFLRKDRVSYTFATTMDGLYASMHSYLWLVKGEPYGWLNAVFWLIFAGIIVMVSSWPDIVE